MTQRKGSSGKRVLLIGHMDTVFEPSSPFQKFERNGGTAVGPGVSDMKGGVVVMISALKSLHKAGALEGAQITVFLTGDEEAAGKPIEISRKEFIDAGKNSQAALCFEGPVEKLDTTVISQPALFVSSLAALEMLRAEKRVTVTALQTVGSKGYDGFAMALVTSDPQAPGPPNKP